MLAEVPSLRERLSLLIQWTACPRPTNEIPGAWGLWFDLWAQAFRHDEVKAGRVELDARWRRMIVDASWSRPTLDTDVDAAMFALEFSALLDGLSIQVALEDPEVDSEWPTTSRCASPSASSTCPSATRKRGLRKR